MKTIKATIAGLYSNGKPLVVEILNIQYIPKKHNNYYKVIFINEKNQIDDVNIDYLDEITLINE